MLTDTLQPMIDQLEEKDLYTQGHSHHVFVITNAIYDHLPETQRKGLANRELLTAALLHDIGKTKIPDAILKKEGALTAQEYDIMKRHPEYGSELLKSHGYSQVADWVLYHHERVDGGGYYGLPEHQIPLASKIIAVADTFSALRTYRIYRDAKSVEEAVQILEASKGTQLDAEITDCFLALGKDALGRLKCHCAICERRRREKYVQQR